MTKEPIKQSAYSDYLYRVMDEILIERGGAFTLKELSEKAKLKITPNFRRRVNHCVATGKLKVLPIMTTGTGSCNLFYVDEIFGADGIAF